MKVSNIITHGLIFILFFMLFYLEPISIGGMKFSLLWKLPLVLLLGCYFILLIVKKQALPAFVFFGILLAFKFFISLSALEYITTTITEFIKLAIFFLLFVYFQNKYDRKTLIDFGKYLSIYIVISFIPFMLGFLESFGKSTDLSKFGDITGNSLIGIFQNPHAAGITLAFAMLVLYFNLLNEIDYKIKLLLFGLLVIGFIELSLTMVRTSLAMFIIGAFFLSYKYLKIKHYLFAILIMSMGFLYFSSAYQENRLLQAMVVRLQGDTKYKDFDEVGSGRLQFASIAINSWQSEGMPGVVIGLGMELGKDKMGEAFGTRLVAHNGFVQILQSEGIIGIVLLLLFLFYLFKYIRKYKDDSIYPLVISMLIAYIVFYYVQGGNYFLMYVLFAMYLAVLSKNNILFKKELKR